MPLVPVEQGFRMGGGESGAEEVDPPESGPDSIQMVVRLRRLASLDGSERGERHPERSAFAQLPDKLGGGSLRARERPANVAGEPLHDRLPLRKERLPPLGRLFGCAHKGGCLASSSLERE